MQGGGRGNNDFFGFGIDPFAGFERLARPGGHFAGMFGGRDPFDDPFFTHPFGSMLGQGMFGRSIFDTLRSPFEHTQSTGFLDGQPTQNNKSRGPVIKELDPDEDEGTHAGGSGGGKFAGEHHMFSQEPYVEDPDEGMKEDKVRHQQQRNTYFGAGSSTLQPGTNAYTFRSSTVTYGGTDGAYYTSSTTRRTGGDGVTVEESKEADTTTGKATHRISRGIRGKGHSVTRKLNSDGRVDTTQTLHNINEEELPSFEEAWKGNAKQYLPGWDHDVDMLHSGSGGVAGGQLAFPFREQRRQEPRRPGWQTASANAPTRKRIVID